MQANRILLDQGGEQWLAFRKDKISASKVPIIMGLSPYQTTLQLYEEEMGLREPQSSSPHMQRGLDVEDQVRDWIFITHGVEVKPCVLQSKENPLYIASLDGINSINTCIVEIKNNNKDYHEMVKDGMIPAHHMAQVQFQMFVSGMTDCWYVSYRQGDYCLRIVDRDQEYIDAIVPKLIEFKDRLNNFDPPMPCERDYEDMSQDIELSNLFRIYEEDILKIKQIQGRVDILKKDIQNKVGQKNAKGNGWKLTKYKVSGRVDYDQILRDIAPDLDLAQFRKPDSYAYRITVG